VVIFRVTITHAVQDLRTGIILLWQPEDDVSIAKNPASIMTMDGKDVLRGFNLEALVQPLLPKLWRSVKSGTSLFAYLGEEKVAEAIVHEAFR